MKKDIEENINKQLKNLREHEYSWQQKILANIIHNYAYII